MSLYRSWSLKAVARESGKYRLDLVGVQEVRWDKGVLHKQSVPFFLEKREWKSSFRDMIFCASAVKRVKFIISIVLRGHWWDAIVLNLHAPLRIKVMTKRTVSMRN
jgi:hypothetical protein